MICLWFRLKTHAFKFSDLYNAYSVQENVRSYLLLPYSLSYWYLLDTVSVNVDERVALDFPPAVVSFSRYLIESSWEGERDPLSTSECRLCSLSTGSILCHFCSVLFCFFNEEFWLLDIIIQWRRFFQKPGANFSSTTIQQWARRPLAGQDVFLVNRAYYNFGGYLEYTIRSALEALKEGWNSELPFDVWSGWLLGFYGLWCLVRREHYTFVKDGKIMT